MNPILIVGWDGATFDLIKPWVAQGRLPNIARVMQQGTHGQLRSTLPPMTFPAWTSFMTGKNPAKHRIFDFTRQKHGTYDLEFVNGGQRRSPTFWTLLSEAGRDVVAISIPCTYPPEKVNGVMLSGFDAAGVGGGSGTLDSRAMHPPELAAELEAETGGHPIGSFPTAEINRSRPDIALQKIKDVVRRKSATAKYLLKAKPWDCFMILFGESDGVGHHFWKYTDPNSPLYEKGPAGVADGIFEVYKELDVQLGELLDLAPENATLLMMSDHGFGGVSDNVLYPNCWLHEQGLLKFRGGSAQWRARTLDAIKLRAVASLPNAAKKAIHRVMGTRLGGIEAQVRYGGIDWSGTKAYFEENPYYPVAWVNLKGRQPGGIVEPGAEYEAVRDEMISKLEAWRHPESGEPMVIRAYRREEVYDGPYLEEAADIIVHWNEHEGYTYAFKLSAKSPDRRWLERVDPSKPENLSFFTGKSGSHRDEGIFLAQGDGIRAGFEIQGAHITDIAPTILHLLGVPIPDDIDGRPLVGMLTSEAAGREVELVAAASHATHEDERQYSAEDEAAVAERLRSLGYID